MTSFRNVWFAGFLGPMLLSGCGTVPDDLAKPVQVSCVYLREPISQIGKYGLLNFAWETRLERGPYIAERQDDSGTYYRAPPGGVRTIRMDDPTHTVATRDGGFYIPNDPNATPKIYDYFSVSNAPVQIPPEGMGCSDVGYTKDPATSIITVIPVVANGAAGGRPGGLIGRPSASGISPGATTRAPYGPIGGMVAVVIISAGVGNIEWSWALQDPAFVAKLKEVAANKFPVKELPPESGSR